MSRISTWGKQHAGPIGIDLGARSIRMVQLSLRPERISVIDCAEQLIPVEVQSPSEYELLLRPAISRMLEEGRFVGNHVVTSMRWDDLQIRQMRIPDDQTDRAEEIIHQQAAEHYDMDPIQTEYRFLLAGDVRDGTDLYREVVVFGVDRSIIQHHIFLLEKLNLHPAAIDAGPCTLFRSFERFCRRGADYNKVNVILDMGYDACRVVVTRGSELLLFKSIPVGGRQFDRMVSEQMDLTLYDASEIRRRIQVGRESASEQDKDTQGEPVVGPHIKRVVFDTLRPALEQLGHELALCLRYCASTFRGLSPDSIVVVGGEAYNQDALHYLSDQLRLPMHLGRPLQNVHIDQHVQGVDRRTGQPEWAMAVGLAFKSIPHGVEVLA